MNSSVWFVNSRCECDVIFVFQLISQRSNVKECNSKMRSRREGGDYALYSDSVTFFHSASSIPLSGVKMCVCDL